MGTTTRTTGPRECSPGRANGPLMAHRGKLITTRDRPLVGIMVLTRVRVVERVTRIELALSAWEADVLPLNYTRVHRSSRCGGPTVPGVPPPVATW